jgi:hypothetical protein
VVGLTTLARGPAGTSRSTWLAATSVPPTGTDWNALGAVDRRYPRTLNPATFHEGVSFLAGAIHVIRAPWAISAYCGAVRRTRPDECRLINAPTAREWSSAATRIWECDGVLLRNGQSTKPFANDHGARFWPCDVSEGTDVLSAGDPARASTTHSSCKPLPVRFDLADVFVPGVRNLPEDPLSFRTLMPTIPVIEADSLASPS